ncbi:MAG: tetratricopeptide repeat protein [Pyrinomonadaceae bacterium]
MKKDNLMSAVLGLIVGLVVGFVFANSVNRGVVEKPAAVTSDSVSSGNPALPPDHPPLGTSSGDPTGTAPLAQVTEAIEKAKQRPQDYEAQMTAADLYYQIQRFEDAARIYEAAVKLKPSQSEPLIKAGNAHFDGENYEVAEKWYLLALEKEPKNITVRTDLGLTFFLREPRDIPRAIKEYKVSLSIDPGHEVTLQNLAAAYRESGDRAALSETIEKLKRINPSNPAVLKAADL